MNRHRAFVFAAATLSAALWAYAYGDGATEPPPSAFTATVGDARGTAEITVQNPDRAALVALYNATDGPNWVDNENWLTDAPL